MEELKKSQSFGTHEKVFLEIVIFEQVIFTLSDDV